VVGRLAILLTIGATLMAGAGCRDEGGSTKAVSVPQPSRAQLAASGLDKLPLAPEEQRVDLTAASFSHPTQVTNPLFPISDLESAVLNGRVEGKDFHTETTLLPYRKTVDWPPGHPVKTLASQYMAFLDGRIQEVALDYYAQADDGSVWYFGEDVFDYDANGFVAFTTDSWLAGRDGPAAMIMPARPAIGNVYRAENIPGLVFEEVEITKVGQAVTGPTGQVAGAIIGRELHDDGTYDNKEFAPGYGEFFTGDRRDVEALALAVPQDAGSGPPPAELQSLSQAADAAFTASRSRDWASATASLRTAETAWRGLPQGSVPHRLGPPLSRGLAALAQAVHSRTQSEAATAAIDLAQAALDIELRYRPITDVDRARFELWARQLAVDAAAQSLGRVRGDVATLEWVRDRFAHSLDPAARTRIDTHLLALREAVIDADLEAAGAEAARLQGTLRQLA
jgi:hypothetical protein